MKRFWENKGESFSDLLATSRGLSGLLNNFHNDQCDMVFLFNRPPERF
jgi:hypothetical protein